MKNITKIVSLLAIPFFMITNSVSAQGFVNLNPTDRTVFSEPYHLDDYSYFGWEVSNENNSSYPVQYEVIKDGTILKSGTVSKGANINGGLPKRGKGEYLLVLKCNKGYTKGCSAIGTVNIAME
ncbi:hypothetical protein CN553_01935 [Bacillus cereus]|uniref:Group-specific protein n=1 Tax=Bacillus cereus TaxID=1396 RepID=A0A9X6YPM7_BACCE|nr:hypothetical protein [Bacillus cereus]PEO02388.1 hypothetical protein CN553_01935 [Bacillus cereus]